MPKLSFSSCGLSPQSRMASPWGSWRSDRWGHRRQLPKVWKTWFIGIFFSPGENGFHYFPPQVRGKPLGSTLEGCAAIIALAEMLIQSKTLLNQYWLLKIMLDWKQLLSLGCLTPHCFLNKNISYSNVGYAGEVFLVLGVSKTFFKIVFQIEDSSETSSPK